MSNTKKVSKCLLPNGKKVVYTHAGRLKNSYNDLPVIKNLKYLGKGTIYSIDNVKQGGAEVLHFWERIQDE